jgi:hypothetical protein
MFVLYAMVSGGLDRLHAADLKYVFQAVGYMM